MKFIRFLEPTHAKCRSTVSHRMREATGSPMHKVWGFLEERTVLTLTTVALLNLVESFLNFLYIYKTHFAPTPVAPLIGLVGATMTLSKTALYCAQEYFCNYCSVGHNTLFDLIVLWIIPNGYHKFFAMMSPALLKNTFLGYGSSFLPSLSTRYGATSQGLCMWRRKARSTTGR